MPLSSTLQTRSNGSCELCNSADATIEYTVSPKSDDPQYQVALCSTCSSLIESKNDAHHWRCLEGSIWSPEPAVQALSYRILQYYSAEEWASNAASAVDLDENVIQWAMSVFDVAEKHKDAFGNELSSGDNVVLTQALDVKGTNFTASKGTVVKKIKLVADNSGQIEGKINEQMIVILTKFVKKL